MSCWTACVIWLFLFTFIIFSQSRRVLSSEFPKCQDENNTAESCCPCYQETIRSCVAKCPDDYLTINASISCENESNSENEVNTTTITTVSTVTENVTQSELAGDDVSVLYCVKSCGDGKWYNNVSLTCENCNESCLKCVEKIECTVCKYEVNNTCLSKCPDGTVDSKNTSVNGTKMCEKAEEGEEEEEKEEEDNKNKLIAYIAGGAGGVVVTIIIIVIIVIRCRKTKASLREDTARKGKTAMSTLLEVEEEQKPKTFSSCKEKSTEKSPRNVEVINKKHRPAGYENMSQTLPTGTAIQNQGDNVLRYTKDPTIVKSNYTENEGGLIEEEEYGNAPMINLSNKTDLTHKSPEAVKEMLEVADMGEAPKPPISLPVSKDKKKRKGIVKSLSQRMSKKLGRKKEKGSPPKPEEHEPEDYVDMSGEQNVPVVKTDSGVGESSSGIKDYENVNFQKIPVGRRAGKPKVQTTSPDNGMEDYENTSFAKSDKTQGDDSALEDYENTKQFHVKDSKKPKGMEKAGKNGEDELDDYENTKELRLDGNKKPKGKGKPGPGKPQEEEMEDYENMKELDLELYENVQVGKKK